MIRAHVFDISICGTRNAEDPFLLHVVTSIFCGVITFWKFDTLIHERKPYIFFAIEKQLRQKNTCSTRALKHDTPGYARRRETRARVFFIPESRSRIDISAQKNRSDMILISFESQDSSASNECRTIYLEWLLCQISSINYENKVNFISESISVAQVKSPYV